MDGQAQGIAVNQTHYTWRLVTTGAPRGSILSPVLFKISISDVEEVSKCTLIKGVGDSELGESVNVLESRAATQRDLDGQEEWANSDLLKFSNGKYKFLHLERKNPLQCTGDSAGDWQTEEQLCRKGLRGLSVDSKLNVSPQCAPT